MYVKLVVLDVRDIWTAGAAVTCQRQRRTRRGFYCHSLVSSHVSTDVPQLCQTKAQS